MESGFDLSEGGESCDLVLEFRESFRRLSYFLLELESNQVIISEIRVFFLFFRLRFRVLVMFLHAVMDTRGFCFFIK